VRSRAVPRYLAAADLRDHDKPFLPLYDRRGDEMTLDDGERIGI
jgi:hypothetical protein